MCPWVGPHAPSFEWQLWGLPSCVQYLSPQGVLLPLVYGTTASPLWLEMRGLFAWQATPSWAVYRLACYGLLPWLLVTFAMVSNAAWPPLDQQPWGTPSATDPMGRLGRPSASDPWGVGSFLSLSRPTCARVCGVPGHLAPVHRYARSVPCVECAVSWVCLAPVHRCARLVCSVVCAVSWATWLLFPGVPAGCAVLRLRCPGPLGSCSRVRVLISLLCVCGVLGHLAPVHRCARSFRCFARVVSWATWLLFTGVPAWCVVLLVRCPGSLGTCSPLWPLGVWCCVCRDLGHLAPVQRSARSVLGFVCAVSLATCFLFTGGPARCAVLRVRCPGPLGSCSLVSAVRPWLRLCGVLGPLAPVHRCAR